MGICNITKDSFSDGGIAFRTKDALKHIKTMIKTGATIIDIGANKGQFTLAARYIFPKSKIFSFEPLPGAAKIFKQYL